MNYYKPTSIDSIYESPISYSNNYSKKRKPQPFSVMLDIYPITDIAENQNKKGNRPRQVPVEDYEVRRPIQYNRGPKFYSPPPQTLSDEDERQQMVFHLNLYPRKKNKMTRWVSITLILTQISNYKTYTSMKLQGILSSIRKIEESLTNK